MAERPPSTLDEFAAQVLNLAPDGIVVSDADGRIVIANARAEQMFGYDAGELLGSRVETLLPWYLRESHARRRARFVAQPAGRAEAAGLARRKDGSTFPAEVSIGALGEGESLLGIAAIRDATERISAAEKAKRDDLLLRAVAEVTTDAIFVKDLQGRHLMINAAGARFLGRERHEIVGKDITELFSPETARAVVEQERGVIASGQTITEEDIVEVASVRRTFLSTKGPLRDEEGNIVGLIGIARDITGRKRIEEALRQSEERFHLLIDGVSDYGIFMLDAEGRVASWSAAAERITGYTSEEVVGQACSIFYTREDIERGVPEQEIERAGREGRFEVEGWRVGKNGSRYLAHVITSALRDNDGRLRGFSRVFRDITERRRLEEEREQLLAEQEKQDERDRIAMDLHDDTIQAIYAVGVGLESAMEDIAGEPGRAQAEVDAAIEQLNEVIRDIRNYIYNLRPARFTGDLRESLTGLVEQFRRTTSCDVSVSIASASALERERALAAFHVAQEALNNVRKHAHASAVSIALVAGDAGIDLEVRDDGAGFDGSVEATEEHRGLRNMRSRAQLAGGTLTVESALGRGTCVHLHVPAVSV